jgi:hypothetical protein
MKNPPTIRGKEAQWHHCLYRLRDAHVAVINLPVASGFILPKALCRRRILNLVNERVIEAEAQFCGTPAVTMAWESFHPADNDSK